MAHQADRAPSDEAPAGAVIAGIDGQDHDVTVATWAADEAASLGLPLHLLEVVDLGISLMAGEGYLPITDLPAESLEGERRALADATRRARERRPGLPVTSASAPGSVTGALVGLSDSAARIVLGGGGKKGRPFVGSTALSVAAHARCPVVVLPDHLGGASGRVVVGIDASKHSKVAALQALEFAARKGASVLAVTAWSVEVVDGCVVTTPGTPEWTKVEVAHRELVERVLAGPRERHPDVPVEIDVRRGKSAAVLLEAGSTADLLVIGGRGRGGFAGMLLGSVSKRVLERATVPVMIVR